MVGETGRRRRRRRSGWWWWIDVSRGEDGWQGNGFLAGWRLGTFRWRHEVAGERIVDEGFWRKRCPCSASELTLLTGDGEEILLLSRLSSCGLHQTYMAVLRNSIS